MRISLLALGLLIPLAACDPRGPVVGGPCSYDSTVFDVTVKAVDDAGITFDVNRALQFAVTADNLTDKVGLTEGNPRIIGSQGTGPILA